MGANSWAQKSIFPPDSLSDGRKQTCIFSAILSPPSGQPSLLFLLLLILLLLRLFLFSQYASLQHGVDRAKGGGTSICPKMTSLLSARIKEIRRKCWFLGWRIFTFLRTVLWTSETRVEKLIKRTTKSGNFATLKIHISSWFPLFHPKANSSFLARWVSPKHPRLYQILLLGCI